MSEQSWSVTSARTIDVDDVNSLKLGIVRGRFDVVVHDEPFVRIEVTEISGDPLAVNVINGRLEIRHQLHGPQGWFRNLMETVNNTSPNSVVVGIAVPAGIEIEAGTVSGDGLVSGVSGNTRLNTVSGSVMADGTRGRLHVNTVSGEVIARNHNGVLTAKSVSGEVTASGTISNVRANTVSGDMSFDLQGSPHDLAANSVSADITVRVPQDVSVNIVAKSAAGTIVVDDRLFAQPGGRVETLRGSGDKLMVVRTNSVSGKTAVVHAGPAADSGDRPVPDQAGR
ncbi:DUF4097 family beta strand repeat-containing protein [Arthrobacter sp. M4]|uniref:DUF4097 family beta strand repeat-containing protein n=1 Tax=Arthrobacter sp. M4 TaxID=218160 RepID=UPI001CDC0C07|nr:DUF4097 family beta strand repeat-containing protein [Arthrobacter sp. M4]MCA4132215.1 DUF4097 domain-containing protein [Arthrobacter sp. M4]